MNKRLLLITIPCSLAICLTSLSLCAQNGSWLSPEDINHANNRIVESSKKTEVAKTAIKKKEEEQTNTVQVKVMPKMTVTYVPTENDIRREAEAIERARRNAILQAKYEVQMKEERRLQAIYAAEQQERDRKEREYQLRVQELQLRQQEAAAQQQSAAIQEARLRQLEQQAAQPQQPARRTLNCFNYGGGFSTCN